MAISRLTQIERRLAELRELEAGVEHVERPPSKARWSEANFPVDAVTILGLCASGCPACAVGVERARLEAERLGLRNERERRKPLPFGGQRHVARPKANVNAVLRAVLRGDRQKAISEEHGISERTVRSYLAKYGPKKKKRKG